MLLVCLLQNLKQIRPKRASSLSDLELRPCSIVTPQPQDGLKILDSYPTHLANG